MSHVSTSFSDTEKEVKVIQSCQTLCDPVDCSLTGFSVHGDSPGKNTEVGCHALLQACQPKDQTQIFCIAGGFFTY